jgi:hypothetical protein
MSISRSRRVRLPVREDITPPVSSAMCVLESIERSLVDIVAAMALQQHGRV